MISVSVIAALILSIIVCFGVPIGGLILLQKKAKKAIKPFLLGAATFLIAQVLLRIPILTYVLPNMTWFTIMQSTNVYLYSLFLGITAGLFEEVGRFITISLFMKKRQRYEDGLSFGLGHGGIEAMLLVGVNLISMLVFVIMINTNTFHTNMEAANGTADIIYKQCISLTAGTVLIGMVERISAMTFHVGATMMILAGFRKNQKLRFLLAAVLLHAALDASVGILPAAFGVSAIGLEIVVGVFALVMLLYTIWSRKKVNWQQNSNNGIEKQAIEAIEG